VNPAALQATVRDGLTGVEAVTRELVAAVEQKDSKAIDRALEERGRRIERLEPQFAALREHGQLDEQLKSAAAALVASGNEVLEALRRSHAATGSMLARLAREAVAIRAYGADLPGASTLDRSG